MWGSSESTAECHSPGPDGGIGLYPPISGPPFDSCCVWSDAEEHETAGGLDSWNTDLHTQSIDKTTDRLGLGNDLGSRNIPVTLKADRDENGTYETTEHVERFTLDSSGYAPDDLTYDAAGNLTYDGVYSYGYDAWNRLVEVTKAARPPTTAPGVVG